MNPKVPANDSVAQLCIFVKDNTVTNHFTQNVKLIDYGHMYMAILILPYQRPRATIQQNISSSLKETTKGQQI